MAPVDRLEIGVYTVPLESPESDGTLTWTETTVVVVEPSAGGVTGLGFTYGPAACATLIRDVLVPVVIGSECLDPPAVWQRMVKAIRNTGRPGVASMAIAAVDIALWDLAARIVDLPLCRLLGKVRDCAPIYGSGGFTSLTDTELTEQLSGWVHDQHIPRVKMKIATGWGSEPARDVARVQLVRDAIGADTELFVDANGGYTRKQAVRLARTFADQNVTWFEEPVSSDDLVGLHEIRGLVDADVAAGEYGYDLSYFERMCAAQAVDVVQADVTRCAGITEWIRIAALAAAHGLQISGHCAPSLHVHAACATLNLRHLEYFADHIRVEHLLLDGVLEPVHGALEPDLSRPGIGLDLKQSDAGQFRRSL